MRPAYEAGQQPTGSPTGLPQLTYDLGFDDKNVFLGQKTEITEALQSHQWQRNRRY